MGSGPNTTTSTSSGETWASMPAASPTTSTGTWTVAEPWMGSMEICTSTVFSPTTCTPLGSLSPTRTSMSWVAPSTSTVSVSTKPGIFSTCWGSLENRVTMEG